MSTHTVAAATNPWGLLATYLGPLVLGAILDRAFHLQALLPPKRSPPIPGTGLFGQTTAILTYLYELSAKDLGHVVDLFPQVLGLSLEAKIKPTVAYLQGLGSTASAASSMYSPRC